MIEKIKSLRRLFLGQFRLLLFWLNGSSIKAGPGFFCARHVYVTRKHKVVAGRNLFIGRYGHFGSHVKIGDNVMIASFVSFVGGDHRFDGIGDTPMRDSGIESNLTTIIEDNVWIGHGSIILSGVRIRSGAVVAAGSVVTKDVEENSIVAGNYAREIRKRII